MAERAYRAGRYFYFHVENSEEIKKVWGELGRRNSITTEPKDAAQIVKEGFERHSTTTITRAEGSGVELSILLYRNIAIIAGFFRLSQGVGEVRERIAYGDLPGMEAAIGKTTILISGDSDALTQLKEASGSYTRIETLFGTLYQFEEEPGHKEHLYLLHPTGDIEGLDHFLRLHFPVFDFLIHKLHKERDYFRTQRSWIVKEKDEINKTIGDILHRRIVGETLNPENIELLEKEIDTLSSKYAILVNDGHLIRTARTVLEEDMEAVYSSLQGFGKPLEEGLMILKDSMELKEKLEGDETSISYAIKNAKTAIDTVRTNVDLLRSRENILLQEKGVSYQVAAAVLEFIIIFYYSIASWEHLIGVHRMELIPPPVRFASIFLFTTLSVVLTHYVGESYREGWKLTRRMLIAGAALIAVFLYILYISIQTGVSASKVLH